MLTLTPNFPIISALFLGPPSFQTSQLSLPLFQARPNSPQESAPVESAPAENLYAEIEHIKPVKEQLPATTSFYPDLSNAQVSVLYL